MLQTRYSFTSFSTYIYVHYNGLFAPKPLVYLNLIEGSCDNVYYCTRNEPLAEGYSDEAGLRMNVYIDHENEVVLDWADMEVLEDDEGHYSELDVDDDKNSQLSDDIPYEHEADGYIPSLDKTRGEI
uniref:Uncharacterized protein n=1 Tax=Lactuca sativa TaxID=4236 RepID=A0A9R1V800_LACSA|nr:hypothetical protein LSAT_V11C600300110 [Lactuca sativa]